MADLHDDTQIIAFDSLSPSGSESSVLRGDGFREFVGTVGETQPLGRLSPETQTERLWFDTEPLDDPDRLQGLGLESVGQCETEVVFDSEDEADCSTEVDKSFIHRRIGRSGDRMMLGISGSFPDEKCGSGANGEKNLLNKCPSTDKLEGLDYISSQEPAELSEAKALDFVESFLTNGVSLSQGVEPIKTVRGRSVSRSNGKGIHYLAKRIKRSPVRERGTFEFESFQQDEFDYSIKRKRMDLGKQIVIKHKKSSCIESEEGSNYFTNECEKSKEQVPKDTMCPSSNSGCKELCVKRSEQLPEMDAQNGSGGDELDHCTLRESSNQTLEASVNGRDMADIYDVGIGTQIAAEAMEALACVITKDTVETLATNNTTHMDTYFHQKDVEQKVTRSKRSARRRSKPISDSSPRLCKHQESDPKCETPETQKGKRKKQKKVVRGKRLIRLSSRGGKSESKASLNRQGQQSEGEFDKMMDGRPNFINHDRQGGLLTYKRKRKGITPDAAKTLSGKGCSPSPLLNASNEVIDDRLGEQHVAIVRSNFHEWIYPKRKRTSRRARKSGPTMIKPAPNNLIDVQENRDHSVRSQRTSRDDKTDFDTLHMKEPVHTDILHPISENPRESSARQGSNEQESSFYFSDVTNIRVPPLLLDKPKKSSLYTKIDFVDAESNNRNAENNPCGASLNNNAETSVKTHDASIPENGAAAFLVRTPLVYQRRPCNKNLPKSSLLKELIKLSNSYSIPDVKFKYLRRRRDVAHVRVLFSQHLDDNIIKQQKKISARMGILITSDPKDAMHFLANRFVRTRNMLEAIARAKPVVTHLWLEDCGEANCLLDERNYILRDTKKEKEIGFTMPASLAQASHAPLLKGKRVFVTPNVKPDKETIIGLIEAAQGHTVERSILSDSNNQETLEDLLILSTEQDKEICAPFIDKGYSSELLLTGIITQKLDYERYKIPLNRNRTLKDLKTKWRKENKALHD